MVNIQWTLIRCMYLFEHIFWKMTIENSSLWFYWNGSFSRLLEIDWVYSIFPRVIVGRAFLTLPYFMKNPPILPTHIVALCYWLNRWLSHIWCIILLNEGVRLWGYIYFTFARPKLLYQVFHKTLPFINYHLNKKYNM